MKTAVVSLACAIAMLASACSTSDPERELQALVAAAEEAAEARQMAFFRDLISPAYVDARGRRRDDVIDLIRGFFLVNSRVDIVSRVDEITLDGSAAATIAVQAGLLARSEERGLLGADAGLHRIVAELVRDDGQWHVIRMEWDND